MKQKKYLKQTWCRPGLVVKKSAIINKGVFTAKPIKAGEVIFIIGGDVVGREELDKSNYRELSFFPIDDNLLLASTIKTIDEHMNHSCDPSSWLTDEVTLIAKRDIQPGEEITWDAATWDCDADWTYTETGVCLCGSHLCRQTISPRDWQRPELQKRYQGHFSPYIQRKIDALNKTK